MDVRFAKEGAARVTKRTGKSSGRTQQMTAASRTFMYYKILPCLCLACPLTKCKDQCIIHCFLAEVHSGCIQAVGKRLLSTHRACCKLASRRWQTVRMNAHGRVSSPVACIKLEAHPTEPAASNGLCQWPALSRAGQQHLKPDSLVGNAHTRLGPGNS